MQHMPGGHGSKSHVMYQFTVLEYFSQNTYLRLDILEVCLALIEFTNGAMHLLIRLGTECGCDTFCLDIVKGMLKENVYLRKAPIFWLKAII